MRLMFTGSHVESPAVQPRQMNNMSFEVDLWIPRAPSPNLRKVVRAARAFDQFTEPEDNAEPYLLTLGLQELRTKYWEFTRIYEDIRTWKGTELRVNGGVGDRGTINDEAWSRSGQ